MSQRASASWGYKRPTLRMNILKIPPLNWRTTHQEACSKVNTHPRWIILLPVMRRPQTAVMSEKNTPRRR